MVKLETGIREFDRRVGGIESGSRTISYGPLDTCARPLEWIQFRITGKSIERPKT